MNKSIISAITVAILSVTTLPAAAQDYHWQGGSDNPHWDAARSYHDGGDRNDRRMTRDDYYYRGGDGRDYCRRGDGSTGLIVGGLGGAVVGGAIGGSALSTVLGAAGGAALGASIDRGDVHCR